MDITQLLIDMTVVLGVVLMTLLAVVPLWLEAAAKADHARTLVARPARQPAEVPTARRSAAAHRPRAV